MGINSIRKGDVVAVLAGSNLWSKLGGPWKETEVKTIAPEPEGVVDAVYALKHTVTGAEVELATVKIGTHGELYTVERHRLIKR